MQVYVCLTRLFAVYFALLFMFFNGKRVHELVDCARDRLWYMVEV